MKYQRICIGLVCLLASFLTACETWDSVVEYIVGDKEEKCPDVKILAEAAVLPAFDPAKDRDPTNFIYTATMTATDLSCAYRKKQNRARSDIAIHFHAVRPAGGKKALYRVPYFIALTTNGRVLEKKPYWQELSFDEGVSVFDADIKLEDINLKPKRGRPATYYHYAIGFQLTQAQIDYNKTMGRFEP
jgi:hypothetical protein